MTEHKDNQDNSDIFDSLHLDTLAIRTGHQRTQHSEHSEPVFLTSSYVFDSAQQAAAIFAGEEPGNVYSRYTNPTVTAFEERICALEGGEKAVATSSGMAAILSTCMALLKSGDQNSDGLASLTIANELLLGQSADFGQSGGGTPLVGQVSFGDQQYGRIAMPGGTWHSEIITKVQPP